MEEKESKRSDNAVTIDIDEVHFYLEADLRRKWSFKGSSSVFVKSNSSGRSKLSYYGAVVPEKGEIILMEAEKFNQEETAKFLELVRSHFPGRRIDLVWDRASHHKGGKVKEALARYNIREEALPPYSPELSKIEPLWKWIREKVTYNYGHNKKEELRKNILATVDEIKCSPEKISKRLKRNTSQIKELLEIEEKMNPRNSYYSLYRYG